ncbi:MAG TPA: hypothetical protein PKZ76_03320 [Xanthomonadaceae bacterium]|nr:hypothetical protein [Xanthomonadaceae bacterium]
MKVPNKSAGGTFIRHDGKLVRYIPPTRPVDGPGLRAWSAETPTAPSVKSPESSAGRKSRRRTRKSCQE